MTTEIQGQRTRRAQDKARRRQSLLDAAARLFAAHGYAQVSLADVGAEVGVTAQAIYRHFDSKQHLLGQVLVDVSRTLLEGGRWIQSHYPDPTPQLDELISFHVRFALDAPEVIRIQDQEMAQLANEDRQQVRRTQREYVRIWSQALAQLHPADTTKEIRTRVYGIFGLINSTAHSLTGGYRAQRADQRLAHLLAVMAHESAHVGQSPLPRSCYCDL
ncbi:MULTISPECIES: TetR/AcrR family transcriptional regulator [Auritidibacter]|uniref:TetR/AcrR family transcriptional regulator n=1 Tax=Auritidibacter ignavus TaxID=678932 RepID=A0AAJ6DCU8_9MICC|nr:MULTISPECIES: TetR/AcrR family transcriptional regulator [Auritidibacter]PXA80026.1 TetR family transcriptional regulator [Auritidibacter sp. NML120779]AXR73757.1 TetR/AcrR family transcriptional regulator [Auritidibacter sp. NML130574]NIH72347.1 AcrR family transcriptional regulator [Auritidibacter ignavus]PXA76055.1 TetR family transcriptional regulator [Auritidibacter sp. NML100628]PXA78812.1 TetR family transcriptional regulator [Auritidibacter sp. NML120636]